MRAIATSAPAAPSKTRLQELFGELLTRIDLDRVIPRQVRCQDGILDVGGERLDLRAYKRVVVVSIGKAAYRMVDVLRSIVAPIPLGGVVTGPSPVVRDVPGFRCFHGGHPYPNADSLRSAEAAIETLSRSSTSISCASTFRPSRADGCPCWRGARGR